MAEQIYRCHKDSGASRLKNYGIGRKNTNKPIKIVLKDKWLVVIIA
ncbi:MAG: hypothetical protein JXN62_13505 [Bacteroidales bacterium]|nr:hypothetical protein [Bacteroidales bacterium]